MKKLTTLKFLVPLAIVGATSASIIPFTTSCSVAIHKDFQWSDETQIKAELMNKDSDFVKKASEDLNKNYDPTKTSPTDAKMLADVNESLTFNSWCYVMVSALYNYIITDDDSRTSGADTIKLRVEMKDNKLTHNTVASWHAKDDGGKNVELECVRPTDIAEIGIRDGDGGTNNQIQEIYIRSDDGRHVFFEANDGDGMHSVADGHLVAIQGTQVDIDDNDKDIHIHTDQSILSTVFPNVLKWPKIS